MHCRSGRDAIATFSLLLGLLIPGATAPEPNCRVGAASRGALRILLPLNASTVAVGSLLVVRDERSGAAQGGGLVLSIDGAEWLSVPSRPRATQLPLPLSLLPGPHIVHVYAEELADQRDMESVDLQGAYVW